MSTKINTAAIKEAQTQANRIITMAGAIKRDLEKIDLENERSAYAGDERLRLVTASLDHLWCLISCSEFLEEELLTVATRER